MARTALSRAAIVDAAFEQLAAGGLDSITARALADRLGVRAGALYYHLPDMAALADEMATRITRRLFAPLDEPGAVARAPWDELLRRSAHQVRDVLLQHRDGARLVAGTHLVDDDLLSAGEPALARLVAEGFALADAVHAQRTLFAFVIGHVIEEQHRAPSGAPDPRYAPGERAARLDAASAPLTAAGNEAFLADPAEAFAWSVDAIVAGVGSRRRDGGGAGGAVLLGAPGGLSPRTPPPAPA